MKKSGYRTIFHIYLIFFLSLIGAIIAAVGVFYLLITVPAQSGAMLKSDWPKSFTEKFSEQIIFIDQRPQVKQTGIDLLEKNGIGMQLLDSLGNEIFSYQRPSYAKDTYSSTELMRLYQTGELKENCETTSFLGVVSKTGSDYTYILHFPMKISIVTMYLNEERFAGGKIIALLIVGILFLLVLISGLIYGFGITKTMSRLTGSIKEIAARSYLPLQSDGTFKDIYDSLNTLDAEIKASDRLREQTEKMREEWIANITHDLKTPLSPLKGYSELLRNGGISEEQCIRYAQIMLKNTAYMETLIDDLKLTYQLDNAMIPLNRQEQDLIRFLKELVIGILNIPEYENRTIHFETPEKGLIFSFDQTLLTRAFQNLMVNAFVHGDEHTELTLQISLSDALLQIVVSDNGKGMTAEEAGLLFQRYYRGTNTAHKTAGTGLGLAITKSIVELHGGTISVTSIPDIGTAFQIQFPINQG